MTSSSNIKGFEGKLMKRILVFLFVFPLLGMFGFVGIGIWSCLIYDNLN